MTSRRAFNLTMFAIATALLMGAAFRIVAVWTHPFWQALGPWDLVHYLLATHRWLESGTPYVASEVAGRFEYGGLTFLHPPIALPFFAIFLVVPIQLFWILPLAAFAWLVLIERPASWTWPLIAGALLVYPLGQAIWSGNTDMWAWAFFAAGIRWGWPLALLAIKPSLAVMAFVGIRDRTTRRAVLLMAIICVPFGSLWIVWFHVLVNSPGSLLYSAHNAWMFAIPLVARIGSRRAPLVWPALPDARPWVRAWVATRMAAAAVLPGAGSQLALSPVLTKADRGR
jgi:hypothetical protein